MKKVSQDLCTHEHRESEKGGEAIGEIDTLKESTCLVTHIFRNYEEEEGEGEKRDIRCIKAENRRIYLTHMQPNTKMNGALLEFYC